MPYRCNGCGNITKFAPRPENNCKECGKPGWSITNEDGIPPRLKRVVPVALDRDDMKWDKGKIKMSLVIPEFYELMANILTLGEVNHPKIEGQPSWQLVEPEAYIDALQRHYIKFMADPKSLDKDMGTHHMGHIAVNAMFLWWLSTKNSISPLLAVDNEGHDENQE